MGKTCHMGENGMKERDRREHAAHIVFPLSSLSSLVNSNGMKDRPEHAAHIVVPLSPLSSLVHSHTLNRSIAVSKHHTKCAVRLIEGGCDKEHRNRAGWTVLMIAAGNGDVESVATLVKRGCNVNADTNHGMTALVVARARGGRKGEEICKILKDAGALEKEALVEQKKIWAIEEEERRNRPQTAEDRPATSEQRRREQSKIRVL